MPAKIARSSPRRSFTLPKESVVDQTSLLSCRKVTKTRIFTSDREPYGESRLQKFRNIACKACRLRHWCEARSPLFTLMAPNPRARAREGRGCCRRRSFY
jgi:hypothetical protein